MIPLTLALMLAVPLAAQVESQSVAIPEEEPVYTVVEEDPEFPGGIEALYQYLSSNIKYPEKAKAEKITGRVFISFVIEKDGSISNAKVLRCPDEMLCDEAMRVVKAMPKWKPGRQRGKRVRTQYTLPISFTLN